MDRGDNYLHEEYLKVKEKIKDKYQKDDGLAESIVDHILSKFLKSVIDDVDNLNLKDFYRKYAVGLIIFDSNDFTCSEIEKIIEETPLSERDREIAKLRYLKLKSEEEIAYALNIDKKTVHTNIPKISNLLKRTCIKMIL